VAGLAVLLAGCDPATATPSASATPRASAGAVQTRPPQGSVGVLPGPYAVVATNSVGQVASYQVLLITTDARIAAQVTATGAPGNIGLLIGNLTLQRVSASSTRAYYLENGTEIRWLAPDGSTGTVRSIPAGASSQLTFAVSPDDQRIAVTVLTADPAISTTTYVENLRDGSGHVELGRSQGYAGIRWVSGWHGDAVVEEDNGSSCFSYSTTPCAPSYQLVSARNGAVLATPCAPPSESRRPGSAGVVCETVVPGHIGSARAPATQPTGTIAAADWTGKQRVFLTNNDPGKGLAVGGCVLAPDGAQMACSATATQALTFLTPAGALRDLGAGYRILGWIDSGHLLVAVDVQTLGVVAVERGSTRLLVKGETDFMDLAATLPPTL
jgi:hypothetical protein